MTTTPPSISILPVAGIGEVEEGDDLAAMLVDALRPLSPAPGEVLVVTHKVVSKSEGAVAVLPDDGPDAHRALVEEESKSIIRRRGDLVVAETHHGFICANAGVDRSNAAPGTAVLLPRDPDRSARRIRARIKAALDIELAVIISDTFGRPWREGVLDVAIGVAGMLPIDDLRGTQDQFGKILDVTEVAIVDELAAAADLVMGKATMIPAALIRGASIPAGEGSISDIIRPADKDLFR